MSLKIKIDDLFGLHNGFTLEIEPGFTALVGPNGSGKTTLLQQIQAYARKQGIHVWEYSNLSDGGEHAKGWHLLHRRLDKLIESVLASEGENVVFNFADKVGDLGRTVKEAYEKGRPLIVLLDAIDSGVSIDKAMELRSLFDLIHERDVPKGAEVYIIMAVNHYEFAKSPADCVNVRTGEHVQFLSYDSYAKFICTFREKFKRV